MTRRLLIMLTLMLLASGCVERRLRIDSEPRGAVVWLNGEEVGATPVQTRFLWYGDYDVTLRKDGYTALRTHRKIDAPVYQWPGIDLIFECLLPFEFVDEHLWDFTLTAAGGSDPNALLDRAQSLQRQVLRGPMREEIPAAGY